MCQLSVCCERRLRLCCSCCWSRHTSWVASHWTSGELDLVSHNKELPTTVPYYWTGYPSIFLTACYTVACRISRDVMKFKIRFKCWISNISADAKFIKLCRRLSVVLKQVSLEWTSSFLIRHEHRWGCSLLLMEWIQDMSKAVKLI